MHNYREVGFMTRRPSRTEASVYGWIVTHEHMDISAMSEDLGISRQDAEKAYRRLVVRGLLHRDAEDGARVRAVDPDLLQAVATTPVEREIRRQQERLEQIREQFRGMRESYLEGLSSRGMLVETIPTPGEVHAAVARAAGQCRSESLSSQLGGNRDQEVFAEATNRDRALLERGVSLRTLYHHTSRLSGPAQAYVATMSELGAEYRTAHELFGQIFIFDREIAFIPEGPDSPGAVLIREPSIVRYLHTIFEQTWVHAEPFSNPAADGLKAVSKAIDRTIVRLLASGLKDEKIARRLGMSLRTTRRHIAHIMDSVGADSRFQAGVLLAERGLIDAEEQKSSQ